jgi:hypothetical protein
MANANSTLIDSPLDRLTVKEYWWGKLYKGTQADLIGAGLVKLEWFPGPGTAKTATRVGIIDGERKVLPFGRAATREQEEKGLVKIFQPSKNIFEGTHNLQPRTARHRKSQAGSRTAARREKTVIRCRPEKPRRLSRC